MNLYVIAADKANHISYGALAGCVGGMLGVAAVFAIMLPLWVPPLLAFAAGMLAGWYKDRIIDAQFNADDFLNTVLGATFVALPLALLWILLRVS